MKAVIFTKPANVGAVAYGPGERATFSSEDADRLVSLGFATYAEPILSRVATAVGLRSKVAKQTEGK
ncbi:MAG: hypothetical protein ACR652_09760 [Methylocystis sp.]|uniref:hypothetical protein n=1 Tax=Methylocystis sp. TaxID=1911079 RepID=UPI003DA4A768